MVGLGRKRLHLKVGGRRHDICHMHHMQRMCKIISPRVRFYIVKVLFEQFMKVSFCFFVMQANDKVLSDLASQRLGHYSSFRTRNAKLS